MPKTKTEIERLKKRIIGRIEGLIRDTDKLFVIIEERDILAREKEQLEAELEQMQGKVIWAERIIELGE